MHRPTPRRAFTLVELLVVIGLVATLMVLLLPAVNRAWEGARRGRCMMNQSRLAMAMAMYDGRNTFLPGVRNNLMITNTPLGVPPPGMSTPGWFIMLLPLLERQDLFNAVVAGQINFFSPNAGNNTLTVPNAGGPKAMAVDLAACPSSGFWAGIGRGYANMFYRANGAGNFSTPFKIDDGAIGDNANGIYSTLADIAAGDGTSSTLLITENLDGINNVIALQQTWWPQLVTNKIPGTTTDVDSNTPGAVNFGGYWFLPKIEAGGSNLFGFSGTPTATTKIVNGSNTNVPHPSSAHPGGAVVAFADGSARFLKDDLKPHVYGHLVTRRSVWNGTTYSNNSALANGFLQCSPAPKPYTLDTADY